MTRNDLTALVRTIAEAAARCVGAEPRHTNGHVGIHGPYFSARRQSVELAARAGDWRVKGSAVGSTVQTANPALNAAAVLALRERLTAQAEERRRLLAADEAALRVLDAEARLYDAATVNEAVGALVDDADGALADRVRRCVGRRCSCDGHPTPPAGGPWTTDEVRRGAAEAGEASRLLDACDAILRRCGGSGGGWRPDHCTSCNGTGDVWERRAKGGEP